MSRDMKIGLIGRVDPGVSVVFRIIVYDELNIRDVDRRVRLIVSKNATVFRCAVYSRDVLENGWQPFEQPSACAYMPLAYSDLAEQALSQFGAVLIDQHPRQGEFQEFLVEGDSSRVTMFDLDRDGTRDILSRMCMSAGMTKQDVNATVKAIEKPVSLATKAA